MRKVLFYVNERIVHQRGQVEFDIVLDKVYYLTSSVIVHCFTSVENNTVTIVNQLHSYGYHIYRLLCNIILIPIVKKVRCIS